MGSMYCISIFRKLSFCCSSETELETTGILTTAEYDSSLISNMSHRISVMMSNNVPGCAAEPDNGCSCPVDITNIRNNKFHSIGTCRILFHVLFFSFLNFSKRLKLELGSFRCFLQFFLPTRSSGAKK